VFVRRARVPFLRVAPTLLCAFHFLNRTCLLDFILVSSHRNHGKSAVHFCHMHSPFQSCITHRLHFGKQQHSQVNPIAADDATEWFEIFNASPDPVNMTGWQIKESNAANTHNMTSFVIGSGQYKVLGRQSNITGVTVDYVYGSNTSTTGFPQLDEAGDYLFLYSSDGKPQDFAGISAGWGFPSTSGSANAGKSLQLKSLTLANYVGANWCKSSTAWPNATLGDMGTPGKANDCPP
jgi:Lamin Tail Domain